MQYSELFEKPIEENTLCSGKIISFHSDKAVLPNGRECSREYVDFPGGVCVVPVTQEGEVILVRQYRYPFSRVTLEVPAGKLDRKDENPLECAVRELREETGAAAAQIRDLGMMMPSPGYTNERIFMFLATGLTYGEQQPDEDEFLLLERIPLPKLTEMILNNEIQDAKTQLAVLKARAALEASK